MQPPAPALANGPSLQRDTLAPQTLAKCLAGRLAGYGNGRLIHYGEDGSHAESYAALWARAASLAAALDEAGVEPDQMVALIVDAIHDFVPAAWACIRAGLTFVPLDGMARAAGRHDADMEELLAAVASLRRPVLLIDNNFQRIGDVLERRTGARVIALGSLSGASGICDERPAAAPVCLVSTSGSTGRVKLAALSEEAILHRAFVTCAPTAQEAASVLCLFPPDGVSGLSVVFPQHAEWIQLSPQLFTQRPLSALEAMEKYRVELVLLTNSMAALIVAQARAHDRRWDLSALRHVHLGGEPIVPQLMREFARLLHDNGAPEVTLLAGYGTTETGALVQGADPTRVETDETGEETVSLGTCAPGVALRIVDGSGRLLPEGAVGEVEAFCHQKIFSGYWGDPSGAADGFREDGWWRTGDLACLKEGRLTLRGRAKEIFISFGRKVCLADVDAHLITVLGDAIRAFACVIPGPQDASEQLAIVFISPSRFFDVNLIAGEIRRAIASRFGLPALRIYRGETRQLPFSSSGKLRRVELARRVRDGVFEDLRLQGSSPRASTRDELDLHVAIAWREALGESATLHPGASFFENGGDSLKATLLFALLVDRLQVTIDLESFFKRPTLADLQRLLREAVDAGPVAPPPKDPASPAWPLPLDLRNRLQGYFETWDGARPTRDRLIASLNAGGSKPPLFWCFQSNNEFRRLAERLGPDQPLYGLRSGHMLIGYDEDEIQTLALRYVHEILEARPSGPLFVGGNCQGAVIALAIAQHLARRGRHVPLLVLMEWGFPLQPYAGPVLLLHGRESWQGNGYLRFRNPEPGWRRAFASHAVAEIPGAHGEFFRDENVAALAATLSRHLEEAMTRPAPLLPCFRDEIAIDAEPPPDTMFPGGCVALNVSVENRSACAIGAPGSGIAIGYYWLDQHSKPLHRAEGVVELPVLATRARHQAKLHICAPTSTGSFRLKIDLLEQGSHWLHAATGPTFLIEIKSSSIPGL